MLIKLLNISIYFTQSRGEHRYKNKHTQRNESPADKKHQQHHHHPNNHQSEAGGKHTEYHNQHNK